MLTGLQCVLWCLVISHGALSNRGDDFRALKLAELQPYGMTHLDGRTSVFTVLGLQGEEKAGKRGMRTVCFCLTHPMCTVLIPS